MYSSPSYRKLCSHITKLGQQGKHFLTSGDAHKKYFTHLFNWFCIVFSELLDPSFLFALDNGEKYAFQPRRFTTLLKMTRVKVIFKAFITLISTTTFLVYVLVLQIHTCNFGER